MEEKEGLQGSSTRVEQELMAAAMAQAAPRQETGCPLSQGAGQPSSQVNLDHGAASLVAQDSPDDSQLGAPGLKEKETGSL